MRTLHPSASLAAAALALGLTGCMTPRSTPAVSRAVLEARTHREATAACAPLASPARVGFAFGEAGLNELATPALEDLGRQLACHPEATALVVGQADVHGTPAEQHQLAQARAEAVAKDLQARGVAAGRVQIQAEGAAPAGDATRLVVLAEGRRW